MGESKNIPIKNLFYMLCYAWDILEIKDDIRGGCDNCTNVYDLLARIFTYGIGKLIKGGFNRSYIERIDELSTLRGKIDIPHSILSISSNRHAMFCSYDEYSEDNLFNGILKYTLEFFIINTAISQETKNLIREQLGFFINIKSIAPKKYERKRIRFNQNNKIYVLLINIAVLIYDEMLATEEDGENTFKDFLREKQMHRVFEVFILNFYKKHLDSNYYDVSAPHIEWPLDLDVKVKELWCDFDVQDKLTARRTDVSINTRRDSKLNWQCIIDAKYYQSTFVGGYMNDYDERVRTAHINQIRGYLLDSKFEGFKLGALIYPLVARDLGRGYLYPLKDAPVIVKTINLNRDWGDIEKDLLSFIKKIGDSVRRMPKI